MRKYKEDSFYLPYIKRFAGKLSRQEIADLILQETGDYVEMNHIQGVASKYLISLRMPKKSKPVREIDRKYFEVKRDPFGKCSVIMNKGDI